MNCANFANDFEEERRRNIIERRKLQKYAERVALLEVQVAIQTHQRQTRNTPNMVPVVEE
jgi:hypothetical protein